jgi:hypothetical protein
MLAKHRRYDRLDDSQSPPVAAISRRMKSPKKKPTGAELRSWRVAILRSRAHNLGTIEAPHAKAAKAEAVKVFRLTKKQRKRLLILKRG